LTVTERVLMILIGSASATFLFVQIFPSLTTTGSQIEKHDETVQKIVFVTEATECLYKSENLPECKQACQDISVTQGSVDAFLSKGGKIILKEQKRKNNRYVYSPPEYAEFDIVACRGTEYVLEGPKMIISSLFR